MTKKTSRKAAENHSDRSSFGALLAFPMTGKVNILEDFASGGSTVSCHGMVLAEGYPPSVAEDFFLGLCLNKDGRLTKRSFEVSLCQSGIARGLGILLAVEYQLGILLALGIIAETCYHRAPGGPSKKFGPSPEAHGE